jgi:hypothetical protein
MSFDYLLSLFVVNFNYTVDAFERLTLTQAFQILDMKAEHDHSRLEFWQSEFRNINFFNIKTSMSDTQSIKEPRDLYPLSFDHLHKDKITERLAELSERKLTADEIKMLNL